MPALTIVSDPTFSQSPRTSRLLRRIAASGPRPSSTTTGTTSAQRTASQIATGIRNRNGIITETTTTAITIAPSTGHSRRSAIR